MGTPLWLRAVGCVQSVCVAVCALAEGRVPTHMLRIEHVLASTITPTRSRTGIRNSDIHPLQRGSRSNCRGVVDLCEQRSLTHLGGQGRGVMGVVLCQVLIFFFCGCNVRSRREPHSRFQPISHRFFSAGYREGEVEARPCLPSHLLCRLREYGTRRSRLELPLPTLCGRVALAC